MNDGLPSAEKKLRKGERTRAQILEAALELFRERGYDETTMRAIAERAGVAVGNAYYYFRSKEHLIQAFYQQTHQEHLEASREILARERGLRERLLGVMRAKLDTIMPYHRFAGVLFKTAADPASPLNPFSEESGPTRSRRPRSSPRWWRGRTPVSPRTSRRSSRTCSGSTTWGSSCSGSTTARRGAPAATG